MGCRPNATMTSAVNLLLLLLLLLITKTTADPPTKPPLHSYNISAILAGDPRFTTFNHHLTATGLADVVNNLTTGVTVCALDNSAMSDLLSLHPSRTSLRRLLLFHLFSGYSDAEQLNYCCAWTLYPSPSGAGNEVVDLRNFNGTTYFKYPFSADYSRLIGFVAQIPPHLSILHVSKFLPSPEAMSLTSPIETLKIMARSGCVAFVRALAAAAEAERWFMDYTYIGMTVICPIDAAWEQFLPRFRQLSEDEKIESLLFHAILVYHDKCGMVGENERWSTLASYYRGNGACGEPTVDMAAVGQLIVGVGYDEEGGPLAVYPIRGVLVPDHDPFGVVEYLEPNAPADLAELPTEEECRFRNHLAMVPAPEPSAVADLDFVEDDGTDAAS